MLLLFIHILTSLDRFDGEAQGETHCDMNASGLNAQRAPVALPAGWAGRPPDPLQLMFVAG